MSRQLLQVDMQDCIPNILHQDRAIDFDSCVIQERFYEVSFSQNSKITQLQMCG